MFFSRALGLASADSLDRRGSLATARILRLKGEPNRNAAKFVAGCNRLTVIWGDDNDEGNEDAEPRGWSQLSRQPMIGELMPSQS